MNILHKSFLTIFAVYAFSSSLVFSQEQTQKNITASEVRTVDLSSQRASWETVIGGTAVASPCPTSYGFAVSGDGRMLFACTNSGTVLWQRGVSGRPTQYVCSATGDFLYTVTDNSNLNLINPSGLTLWTVSCSFPITDSPLPGRDGRVFVRGRHTIACYGLKGIQKWQVETDDLNSMPIQELNDGSLLVFYASPQNNRTIGRRFSPFGKELERITFSGLVRAARSCERGVLIALDSGSCGLCSVQNGTADSHWALSGTVIPAGPAPLIASSSESSTAAVLSQFGANVQVSVIDANSGNLVNKFTIENCSISSSGTARITKDGFFFADRKNAYECTFSGTIIWHAVLPPESSWNYLFYSDQGYLVLCMTNWALYAYRMNQHVDDYKQIVSSRSYSSFFEPVPDDSISSLSQPCFTQEELDDASRILTSPGCGDAERELISKETCELMRYNMLRTSGQKNMRREQTYFDTDFAYTSGIISLCSQFGVSSFSPFLSSLATTETEPSLRTSFIEAEGAVSFDPDGTLLSSLQNMMLTQIRPSDRTQLRALCDSVFSICRFMGRPALYAKGKDILAYLFYPQYDKSTRDYARLTMQKIMKLEL